MRQLPQVKQAPRQAVAGDSGKRGSVLNIIKKGKVGGEGMMSRSIYSDLALIVDSYHTFKI